jgi:heparanase 1
MNTNRHLGPCAGIVLAGLAGAAYAQPPSGAWPASIAPASMARIGTVDERFQSFNIEMVEVTGGRFWRPYGKQVDALLKAQPSAGPVGMDPALYRQRPPIDLTNPRLRKLAAALGPAYVRVSGTWANTTYFQDSDDAAPSNPPAGFNGVLTRRQWKDVVDFSRAADARIVTSFATSAGTRDAAGVWTPAQARRFLAYTKSIGGSIAAAEYMNEPTFAEIGGAPKGYDAAAYARDIAVFRPFARQAAPGMVILGPGSVGEGISLVPAGMARGQLKTEDLLTAAGPAFDAFSYHFYGALSKRCAGMVPEAGTTPEDALSEQWLARTGRVEAFYAGLRDRFAPGKPLWLTETADAGCGGNPWGSTFLDSFRYLDQLGRLARSGVQVVAHNTLASSDYGLLDEDTLTPQPNYWSALLWRRLMGPAVLNPGSSSAPALHLYAHCLRGHPGGVALLAINTGRTASQSLELPTESDRYTLTARNLEDTRVDLNGNELRLGANDELPQLAGVPTPSGRVAFAPASITFLAIPNANNGSCR